MGLSSRNWISLFLTLARKYIPNSYQSMSRYSNDLENLFSPMIACINGDEEFAKIRSTMSKLVRRPGARLRLYCIN